MADNIITQPQSSYYQTAFDREELNSRIHRRRVWGYPSVASKVPVPGVPWPVSRGSLSTKNAKRIQGRNNFGDKSMIS